MSATLNLYSLTLAHGDATANNNPSLRFVDWKRSTQGIHVYNPKSEAVVIPAGTEKLIFDGSRILSVDGTTAFTLTLSPLSPTTYRLTWVSGTNPVLRTDRALNLTGVVLTLAPQGNGSLKITAGAGTPFAALQVGDQVFIPGLSTGDVAGAFSSSNEGRWTVLAAAGAQIFLVRPSGEDFVAAGETVTPVSAAQFLGFAATGVQPGDGMDISAGFSSSTQKTYDLTAVTSKWVEFTSTSPLALESGVAPGASGISVFSSAKRFLRIEADQDCVVRANGDTGNSQRLSPWAGGDPEQVAEFVKVGPTWILKVYNRSAQVLNLNVISAE